MIDEGGPEPGPFQRQHPDQAAQCAQPRVAGLPGPYRDRPGRDQPQPWRRARPASQPRGDAAGVEHEALGRGRGQRSRRRDEHHPGERRLQRGRGIRRAVRPPRRPVDLVTGGAQVGGQPLAGRPGRGAIVIGPGAHVEHQPALRPGARGRRHIARLPAQLQQLVPVGHGNRGRRYPAHGHAQRVQERPAALARIRGKPQVRGTQVAMPPGGRLATHAQHADGHRDLVRGGARRLEAAVEDLGRDTLPAAAARGSDTGDAVTQRGARLPFWILHWVSGQYRVGGGHQPPPAQRILGVNLDRSLPVLRGRGGDGLLQRGGEHHPRGQRQQAHQPQSGDRYVNGVCVPRLTRGGDGHLARCAQREHGRAAPADAQPAIGADRQPPGVLAAAGQLYPGAEQRMAGRPRPRSGIHPVRRVPPGSRGQVDDRARARPGHIGPAGGQPGQLRVEDEPIVAAFAQRAGDHPGAAGLVLHRLGQRAAQERMR